MATPNTNAIPEITNIEPTVVDIEGGLGATMNEPISSLITQGEVSEVPVPVSEQSQIHGDVGIETLGEKLRDMRNALDLLNSSAASSTVTQKSATSVGGPSRKSPKFTPVSARSTSGMKFLMHNPLSCRLTMMKTRRWGFFLGHIRGMPVANSLLEIT